MLRRRVLVTTANWQTYKNRRWRNTGCIYSGIHKRTRYPIGNHQKFIFCCRNSLHHPKNRHYRRFQLDDTKELLWLHQNFGTAVNQKYILKFHYTLKTKEDQFAIDRLIIVSDSMVQWGLLFHVTVSHGNTLCVGIGK